MAFVLGLVFAAFAVAQGLGGGSVPAGAVAEVEDADGGTLTQAAFDRALVRVAAQQGLKEPPAPDDPTYGQTRDQAMSEALLPIWILGEGSEQGILPTEEEIGERLTEIKEQGFKDEKEFEKFVEEQGYCTATELKQGSPDDCAGVRREVTVQIVAEELQGQVLPADQQAALDAVPADDVQTFYEQSIVQFQVPETRDVRLIQARDRKQAEEALAQLEEDDSKESWEGVAKEFSEDPASKDRGGLLEGVVEGQSPGGPQFDEQLFGAAVGELVGPFETDAGNYVIQVQKVNPAETTPLSEVEQQIRQQLSAGAQQTASQEFEADFFAKWRRRTTCAEGYITPDCRNAPPPDPCPPEQEEAGGCPPPVVSAKPAQPGTAGTIGGALAPNLPQGPIQPPPPAPPGLPGGGTIPLGPGGAPVPGVPPGAVPPGAVPPGAVPPGAVPPGAAPPVPPPAP